jgi:outer membrane protein W
MLRKEVIFVTLLFLILSSFAFADKQDEKKFTIRARYGFAKYIESYYRNTGCAEFDISFRLSKKLEAGGGFGYYLTYSGENWLNPGKFRHIPLDFFVHFVTKPNEKVHTYFGGGVSYIMFKYQMDAQEEFSHLGFEATQNVDNTIACFVGGGFDILLPNKLWINLDVKYRRISVDATATITDTASKITATDSGTLKINGLTFGFGATIFF